MPPRLVFTPPLSSSTKVPFGHSCSSSVTFKIYVSVHREWFAKFRSEGKRIEVWSDLPGAGRRPGEWGDTPFVEQTPSSPLISPQDLHEVDLDEDPYLVDALTVSLLSPEEEAVQHELPGSRSLVNDKKITLIACFTLPQTYTHYSFTFRIAGPGNRLEWLGSMGSNGTVIVGEPGQRAGFEEIDGEGQWSAQDSSSRTWERSGDSSTLAEIGNFKNVDMIGWAFGKHGISEKISQSKSTKGANILLLHPRLDASIASRPFTDPPSSVLVSSHDNTTILTTSGKLITSAKSVVIQEFYPFCLPTELAIATDNDWETLDSPDGSSAGFIFAKSTDTAVSSGGLLPSSIPSTLAVLPSVSGDTLPPTSEVTFALPMLQELQPNGPVSMLYAPANETIKLIDLTSPEVQAIPRLSLTVGRDGGELTVVPSYEIGAAVDDEAKESEDLWQIGVLAPALSSISVEHDVLAPAPTESAVEPPSENYLASEPDSESAGVVALATPPPVGGSELPAEVEPEMAPSHAVIEEETVPPTSGTSESEHEETSNGPAPAGADPTWNAVALRTQPDHHYFVLVRVVLTLIHVLLGIWHRLFFRVGTRQLPSQVLQAIESAPSPVKEKADKPAEDESVPTEKVPASEDQEAEAAAQEAEEKSPTPPTTDLDAVNEPEEGSPISGADTADQQHPKLTASKSILTPPMTPPQAHAAELVNRLATVVEPPIPAVAPTYKTKLVLTLPPKAPSFKFILAHSDDSEEGAADVERIRLLLDHKEITLPGDGQLVKSRAVAPGKWIVDVDASEKTLGKVEIAVV